MKRASQLMTHTDQEVKRVNMNTGTVNTMQTFNLPSQVFMTVKNDHGDGWTDCIFAFLAT